MLPAPQNTKSPASLAWRTINYHTPYDVPMDWHAPGCYAVYLDGRLTYIGQSLFVRGRIVSHRLRNRIFHADLITPWGSAQDIVIKFKPSRRAGDWLMREYRLLKRLNPYGNTLICRRSAG